jgi:Fur family iron response transcriptional regulator
MTAIVAKLASKPPGSDLEQQFSQFMRREILEREITGRDAAIPSCGRYKALLREAGLRPTHQRMALAHILFSAGNRHVTAEMLYDEAIKANMPLSLATVYNTLKQFTEAGLLSQINVGGGGAKSFFDTNPSEHHHFFVQDEDALIDIPAAEAMIDKLPEAPEGFEIVRVAVVVRLRRKQS